MGNVVTLNGGSNLTDKMKKIQSAITRVGNAKNERAEVNAEIAQIRASMEEIGIPKAAFDMAMRYLNWEPEKRQGFDVAYALVREAGGLPLQGDLFMEATKLASDVEERKEAAKPTAKEIAERKFEQTTRGKAKPSDEPPSPDAKAILDVMDADAAGGE